jgi:hypothetical protein
MNRNAQRMKSAEKKYQRYRKQLRQKKYDNQQWVLRNVPEHKIYRRKERRQTYDLANII